MWKKGMPYVGWSLCKTSIRNSLYAKSGGEIKWQKPHKIIQKEVCIIMKKINAILTGKIYAVKRQYPTLAQLEKRMDTVRKELNKENPRR